MDDEDVRPYTSRNFHSKPLSERSTEMTWEADMDKNWVPMRKRTTALPPHGVVIEMRAGPTTGSKFFHHACPPDRGHDGNHRRGRFHVETNPPAPLEPTVRGFLGQVYQQDGPAVQGMASKR